MPTPSDGANVRFPPPLIYLAGLAFGIAGGRSLELPNLGLGVAVGDVWEVCLPLPAFL
jgi:hypothetical protein